MALGVRSLRRSFRPELEAPLGARDALDDLGSQVDGDVLERSRLAVSEVVTNAVEHAGLRSPQLIDLQVWVLGDLLRIEVADNGPGFDPVVVEPDPGNRVAGGWGLWLVNELTDRWGVDFSQSTCVWMEFDRHLPLAASSRHAADGRQTGLPHLVADALGEAVDGDDARGDAIVPLGGTHTL